MKKVIAAAVAAAFIAPAAIAASADNVTLYGSLRGFADYVDGDNVGSGFKVKDGSSRIGFMGAEKLNSDLSVIWQIETGVNANQGVGTWASRDTFVGLEGSFGTLRLGNSDSAYTRMDTTGPQADVFDNYGASVDVKNAYGFYGRANSRLKNSISFETRDYNGFIARASYGVDNESQKAENGNAWIGSLSGTYTMGGFSMGAGYQYGKKHLSLISGSTKNGKIIVSSGALKSLEDASDSDRLKGAESHAYKVAASFKFDTGTSIGGAWEHVEDKFDANTFASVNKSGKVRQDTYFIAANHPVGNWLFQAGYGWADKLKGDLNVNGESHTEKVDKSKAKMALLGTQYALSKRTRVYGYLFWVDNQANAAFSTGYDSLGFATQGAGAGQTGYGASFGLRTDF